MAEIKLNTELMTNMEIQQQLSSRSGISVYCVKSTKSEQLYVLKHISVPETQKQVQALILTGAAADETAAQAYYEQVVTDYKTELEQLEELSASSNLSCFRSFEIKPKEDGIGFDLYLLSEYRTTLENYLAEHEISQAGAVNMAIDLCNALCELRGAGLIHRDVKPANIYLNEQGHFMLGDLGIAPIEGLKYCSMPELMISSYSAPELFELMASVNETIDLYAVGLILYRIYNGNHAPFEDERTSGKAADKLRITGQALPAPMFADYEMAEILCKACAFAPADRYQTPEEMKQAFVDYMLRNQVGDSPVVPPIVSDEIPVDEESAEEEVEPVQLVDTEDLDDTFKESFSPDNDMLNALIESVHRDIEKDYTAEAEHQMDYYERIIQKPRQKKKKKLFKWLPTALLLIGLSILIAVPIWFFFFRKDTLTVASVEVVDRGIDYITVNLVSTEDPERFEVLCTDKRAATYSKEYTPDEPITFSGLTPGVQYTITIKGFDDEKIAGAVPYKVSTKDTTKVLNPDISRVTASTMELKFVAEGAEPEEWLISYCAEGEKPQTKSFTGHSVILSNLKPDTNYELTLLDSGDVQLTGEVTASGRTLPSVTLIPDSVQATLENSTATIVWEHEGDTPTSWTITTSGDKGYQDTKTVTENMLVLENLVAGETYSLVITCDNMVSGVTASFTVDAYSIATLDAVFNENGELDVSWSSQAETEGVEWIVSYTLDGGHIPASMKTVTGNSVTLTDLFPDCTYTIEIKEANGEQVGGNNKATVTVPAAESFSDYGFTTVYPATYPKPGQENWNANHLTGQRSSFTASESIAFVCEAAKLDGKSEDPIVMLLLVKNEAGHVIDYCTNAETSGVPWNTMWLGNKYARELPSTPSAPGRYTLELYFNNKRVRTTADFTFTITE